MTEELMKEIDNNLRIRGKVKSFFNSPLRRQIIKENKDDFLVNVFLHTLQASYDDLMFYIIQLFEKEFFNKDEVLYVVNAAIRPCDLTEQDVEDYDEVVEELYSYYADSEELISAIDNEVANINNELKAGIYDLPHLIENKKKHLSNKYELFILQRAADHFDYIIFDDGLWSDE